MYQQKYFNAFRSLKQNSLYLRDGALGEGQEILGGDLDVFPLDVNLIGAFHIFVENLLSY